MLLGLKNPKALLVEILFGMERILQYHKLLFLLFKENNILDNDNNSLLGLHTI